eukprot:TRINITY_DN28540_c0_g1_i1.p1 TRINITY_DN28540_c0_g1~~TRINITY_DN28540_c0_g1_i1.p1  ORF type:complete len:152 (-),score=7.92 TRINITY_DN28540_c0_g1_i1:34-489(-)
MIIYGVVGVVAVGVVRLAVALHHSVSFFVEPLHLVYSFGFLCVHAFRPSYHDVLMFHLYISRRALSLVHSHHRYHVAPVLCSFYCLASLTLQCTSYQPTSAAPIEAPYHRWVCWFSLTPAPFMETPAIVDNPSALPHQPSLCSSFSLFDLY